MIQIILNNQSAEIPSENTLSQCLLAWKYQRGFAVAINRIFIPKERYAHTILCEGDQVEIVAPMQGG